MSPVEARRAVGHPDIVEQETRDLLGEIVIAEDIKGNHHPLSRTRNILSASIRKTAEIERLRGTLRAIRGSSDPAWQAKLINEALGETTP